MPRFVLECTEHTDQQCEEMSQEMEQQGVAEVLKYSARPSGWTAHSTAACPGPRHPARWSFALASRSGALYREPLQ